jgi:hypothetical protein
MHLSSQKHGSLAQAAIVPSGSLILVGCAWWGSMFSASPAQRSSAPLISVIIATQNRLETLREALASVRQASKKLASFSHVKIALKDSRTFLADALPTLAEVAELRRRLK